MKSSSLLVAFLLVVAAGCVTPGLYTSPSAIGKGNLQVGIEPALVGAANTSGFAFIPMGNLSLRYGISERLELGGRIGATAIELLSKYQFSDPTSDGPTISIAPTVGGFALASGGSSGGATSSASVGMFGLQVPVLIGFKTGGGSEFFVGPRILDWLIFSSAGGSVGGTGSSASATLNVVNLGTSVGYYARVSEGFALVPEINLLYPVFSTAGVSAGGQSASGSSGFGNGLFFQFGLGLVFGKGAVAAPATGEMTAPPLPTGS
ncbi:MAG: hypothetical protein ACOZIN_02615 [Myxococcota bacterium]